MTPYLIYVIAACFVVKETAGIPYELYENLDDVSTSASTTSAGGKLEVADEVPDSMNDIFTTPSSLTSVAFTEATVSEPSSDVVDVTTIAVHSSAYDGTTTTTPSLPPPNDAALPTTAVIGEIILEAPNLNETASVPNAEEINPFSNESAIEAPIEATTEASNEAEPQTTNTENAESTTTDPSLNDTSSFTSKVESQTFNTPTTDGDDSEEENAGSSIENASKEKIVESTEDYKYRIKGKANKSDKDKNSDVQISSSCTQTRDLCLKRENSQTNCQTSYESCMMGDDKTEVSGMNKRFSLDAIGNGPLDNVVGATLNGSLSSLGNVVGDVTNLVENLTGPDKKCPFSTNPAPQENINVHALLVDKEAPGQTMCPPPAAIPSGGAAPPVTQASPLPLKCPFTDDESVPALPPILKLPVKEEVKSVAPSCECMQELVDKLLKGLSEAHRTGLESALGQLMTRIVKPMVDTFSSVNSLTQGVPLSHPNLNGLSKVLDVSDVTKTVLSNALDSVANLAAPVANLVAPLANLAAPVASLTAPVANLAAPLANLAAPLANLAAPVANLAAPVANLAAPVASLVSDVVSPLLLSGNILGVPPLGVNPPPLPQSKVGDFANLLPVPATSSGSSPTHTNILQTAPSVPSALIPTVHGPEAVSSLLSSNVVNAASVAASNPPPSTANVPSANTAGSSIPASSTNLVNADSANSANVVNTAAASSPVIQPDITNSAPKAAATATNTATALNTAASVPSAQVNTIPAAAVNTVASVPAAQLNTMSALYQNPLAFLLGKRS